jgi:ATP-dependent Clp protease ATP-binding subunit ClpB
MERLDQRISRVGTEVAHWKFTPEFINRIDKIMVFRSLERGTTLESIP